MRDIVFKTLVAKRIAGGGGGDGSCKGSTIKLVKDVVLLVILAAYCSGEDPLCGIVRFVVCEVQVRSVTVLLSSKIKDTKIQR